MSRILVTGGSGYLGGAVLAALRSDEHEVVAAARHDGPDIVGCDLADPRAVARLLADTRPEMVVHCAANVPRSAAGYDDVASAEESLVMARHLAASGVARLVFISSMTVYPEDTEVAAEADASPGSSAYSRAKFEAERLFLAASSDVTVLRLPGLFGPPRRGGLLFNAAAAFARGDEFQLQGPAPMWAAMHVNDAAEMIRRAVRTPRGSRAVNIGYDEPMAITDAVARLARVAGRSWRGPSPRWFRLDLTRMKNDFGTPPATFDERLVEITQWAREAGDAR